MSKRFYVSQKIDSQFELTQEEHRHFAYATRGRVGDTVILCNGDGFDYVGTATHIEREKTLISGITKIPCKAQRSTQITLFQAVPKPDKMEMIVQKFCELGGFCLAPFFSEHSMPTLSKPDRLTKIAIEACKQSGRATLLQISAPQKLQNLDFMPFDLCIFANEHEPTTTLKTLLNKTCSQVLTNPTNKKIAVIVGSEGGFSTKEAEYLSQKAHSITLGNTILRCETASLFLCSCLYYQLEN